MPFIFHPIHSVKEITDFAKKINSDNFKVCLDTGHCIRCGEDLADAVRYIGKDMLFAMHVHDNDGLHDRHWIPKTGVGDWNSFSDVLSEIGFDGVFSFETSVKGEYTEQEQERLEIELAKMGKQLARIV
jgi:sugar phosphate isomerase/epimerase